MSRAPEIQALHNAQKKALIAMIRQALPRLYWRTVLRCLGRLARNARQRATQATRCRKSSDV